jgi:hypothetical protein
MGLGDVRYCFAKAILVISPRLLLGDVLHFDHFHGNDSYFEKVKPYQNNFTSQMIFLQGFIKFDQGISEKLSGQNDVRYCFAKAILVISPRLLLGDVLLFYVSFSLLLLFLLLLLLFFHTFCPLNFSEMP